MKAIRGMFIAIISRNILPKPRPPRCPAHLVGPSPFLRVTHTDSSSSDSAVKQILLTMNEKQSFIIEDLDDYHLVIKADEEWRVRRELEAEVRLRIRHCRSPAIFKESILQSLRRTRTAWNRRPEVLRARTHRLCGLD